MNIPPPLPGQAPACQDPSEWADGPALIAIGGPHVDNGHLPLGTREYDWHSHLRGQIFCVESGLVHVRTRTGSWLLPPNRAGWMPPGEPHKVSVSGALSGWSLLLTPEAAGALSRQPCVIGINDVMRALVRRAVTWPWDGVREAEQARIIAVLIDEVRLAPREQLYLPMPTDRRLLKIATTFLQQPGDKRGLDAWAAHAGLSTRTLSRVFRAQTGNSFAQWCQQARLTRALELLARGESVAAVADQLGYATASAFIALFRRAFGNSPARYFAR